MEIVRLNDYLHLLPEEESSTENLFPAGYVKEKAGITANELQALQTEADKNDVLLPAELNRPPCPCDDSLENEEKLLPNGF